MEETDMRNTLIHFEKNAQHSNLPTFVFLNVLYDRAMFYTVNEYNQKFKKQVSIQSIVENQELYIIGRYK